MTAAGHHDRQIGNMLAIGVIAELDTTTKRVRVDVDGMKTDWIPWLTQRAGPNRDWHPPEVGAQVLVASPYGDPAQGVVVGSIYQNDFDAPADVATVDRAVFEDGSVIEYDREAHQLKVDVGDGTVIVNCKLATVTATEKITFDTPEAHFTGKITAEDDITTTAEVKAGDIGLKSHKHTEEGDGNPTSPSIP